MGLAGNVNCSGENSRAAECFAFPKEESTLRPLYSCTGFSKNEGTAALV